MKLPRRFTALPLALILLWTMVVAPWAIARCEHACGETRMHALGAICDDDAGHCGDHARADGERGAGLKTGNAGEPPACAPFKAAAATPQDSSPGLKTPPPAIFIPVYPVSLAPLSGHAGPPPPHLAGAPPTTPSRKTHGRGALPLLI